MSDLSGTPGIPGSSDIRLEAVVSDIGLTPGHPGTVMVLLRNVEPEPRSYNVGLVGFEPHWVTGPDRVGPLAPGESASVAFTVTLPTGFPASDLAAGLAIQPVDPLTGAAAGPPLAVDLAVTVGDGTAISASLEPGDVRGAERGRFLVVLHNRGRLATRLELSSASVADEVRIRFAEPSVTVLPGEEIRIKAMVQADRPKFGSPRRRPFVVRVQGKSTPVVLDGAFTQRARISKSAFRILAVIAILGLYVALAILLLGRVSGTLQKRTAKSAASGPAAGPAIAGGVTGGSSATGGATGGAGGGGGGGTGGTGASGGGGTGATNGGAGGGAGGGASGGASGGAGGAGGAGGVVAASPGTRVSGKVAAPDPSGVTVSIAPTSLVDEAAQMGATSKLASAVGATGPPGKTLAQLSAPIIGRALGTSTSTTTAPDGAWAFAGVHAPGYYLVTFTKPGYQTVSYVVTTTIDNSPVQLGSTLKPGSGAIGGSVVSAAGPLGGVDVTITNGAVTLVTRTPTSGPVGTWSVSGLSTPGTYLVTATRGGYATQTSLVSLKAGQTLAGVALNMPTGAGSITGTVTSVASTAAGGGVGGVTVTATTGSTTLTATSSTVDPIGSFTLPNLAIPATYSLTVSGPGWVTQTQQVQLTGNSVVNASLTPTTGSVAGTISTTSAASSACGENPPGANLGLANAGLTLANDQSSFKTLSASAPPGQFALDGIPPGHYTLAASAFEYAGQVAQVDVVPGTTATANLILPCIGPVDQKTSKLTGHVADLFNPSDTLVNTGTPIPDKVTTGMFVTVDGTPFPTSGCAPPAGSTFCVTYTPSSGDYTIAGLGAGIHTIRAACPPGFETVTVQVPVGLASQGFAPNILLPRLDKLSGVVSSRAGGVVPGGTVSLYDPSGKPVVSGPIDATGHYVVTGVTHGTYFVVASGPGFVPSAPPATVPATTQTVTLALDTDQVLNFTLDQLPVLQVSTQVTGPGGGLSPLAVTGIKVTGPAGSNLQPPPAPPATVTSETFASPTDTNVFGAGSLATDAYTVSVPGAPAGDTQRGCVLVPASGPVAQSCSFTAALNQTYSMTVIFSNFSIPTTGVTGSLEYRERSQATPLPVPLSTGPVVSMTVVQSYNFTGPGGAATPVKHTYTDPPNGTFPAGTGTTFNFPAADGNLSPTADFSVATATGFQPFAAAAVTTAASGEPLLPFDLSPTPVPVAGTVALNPAGSTSGVTATVSDANVTVTVDATGRVVWTDATLSAAGQARPDIYTITFQKAGFDPVTINPTMGLCTASPCPTQTLPTVTLQQRAAITATASGTGNVNGATFTLFNHGTVVGSPITAAADSNSVTFTGLTAAGAGYAVAAVKAGYQVPQTLSTAAIAVPVTSGCACTVDYPLTRLGSISGTVQLQPFVGGPKSAGAGVVVSATPATGPCVFQATTDAVGGFTIVGTTTFACQGLNAGAYSLTTAPVAGYTALPATSTTLTQGQQLTGESLVLTASTITVSGVVTDSAGTNLSGVTVSAVNGVTAATTTGTTGANGAVSLPLAPATYRVTYTLFGYATITVNLSLLPNVTPPSLDARMTQDLNTLTGATTQVSSSGAVTPLDAVTVNVTNLTSHTTLPATVSAIPPAGGAARYVIDNLVDGDYQITFTKDGYTSPAPQTKTLTGSNTYQVDGALPVLLHSVKVTAQSGVGSAPVPGATITFGGVTQTAGVDGSTTFSNQAPATYAVSATRNPQTPATRGTSNYTLAAQAVAYDPLTTTVSLVEGVVSGTSTVTGGAPVTVTITGTTSGGTPTAVTASPTPSGGRYQQFLPPGTYTVTFSAAGYADDSHTAVAVTDGGTATVNANLSPVGRSVVVTLQSAVGNATVSHASVTLNAATVVTAIDGTATFASVPPGSYPVTVDATAATASNGQLTPHLGQPSTATMTIIVPVATGASPPPVTGVVQLVEGEITGTAAVPGNTPIAVVVTASTGSPTTTITGINGTYRAFVPPGTFSVTFQAPGYNNDAHPGIVVDNSVIAPAVNANLAPLNHDVTIQALSAVPAPNGTGINGAGVTLTPTGGGTAFSGTTGHVALSEGVITFTGVAPGTYNIAVDGSTATPSHLSASVTNFVIPIQVANPPTEVVTIQEAEITGQVSLAAGSGPATVTITGTPAVTLHPALNSGRYDAFVSPGTYTVGLSATGYSPPTPTPTAVTLTAGQVTTQPTYTLTPQTHTVTVAVTSAVGSQPLNGASVTLGSGPGAMTVTTATTAAGSGIATFSAVAPSATAYAISVDATSLRHRSATGSVLVSVSPSDPPTTIITISEVEISGTVTLSGAGTPVVTIASTSATVTPALTGGVYQAFVAPGSYTVTFNASGYQAQTKSEALTTAGDSDTAASASLSPLVVTVTVTSDVSGTAVVGEMVSANGLTTTATVAGGVATFSGVAPGSYTFSAAPGTTNPHFGPASNTLIVPAVATSPLAVSLHLVEGEVSGTVSIASGSTCAATTSTVTIAGPSTTTVTASVGGSYAAFLRPGSYTVSFTTGTAGCTAPSSATVTVTDAVVTPVNGVFG